MITKKNSRNINSSSDFKFSFSKVHDLTDINTSTFGVLRFKNILNHENYKLKSF